MSFQLKMTSFKTEMSCPEILRWRGFAIRAHNIMAQITNLRQHVIGLRNNVSV